MKYLILNNRYLKIMLFLIYITLIVKCDNKPDVDYDSNETIKHLNHLSEKVKHFKDIFIPVDTIKFEFTEKSAFGVIGQICKHPKGYLILDQYYSKEVYLFDENGKFLKRLGQRGEGPQEYKRPSYIFIDELGNSYILDKTLRKILQFNIDCSSAKDLVYNLLNINPSSFIVRNKGTSIEFTFFDPHNSQGNKLHIVNYNGTNLSLISSFGEPEDMLARLPFHIGPIGLTSTGTIWTSHGFDLDIDIYSLNGIKIKTIERHKSQLPNPHINPEYFKGFNRLSESLDTYYKYTRFYKFHFLRDFVIGWYLGPNEEKENRYFIFFDNSGNPLAVTLNEGKNLSIIGNHKDEIYMNIGIEENELNESMKPSLVIYKIKK
jgi:hypothetical protein